MQILLTVLTYLLCPIGMGLMMWFLMRDNSSRPANMQDMQDMKHVHMQVEDRLAEQARLSTQTATPEQPTHVERSTEFSSTAKAIRMLTTCLNPKVIGVLAVVGIGIWVVAPGLIGAALPLLLVAICPLSMIVMSLGMHGDHSDHTIGKHAPDNSTNLPLT